MKLTQGYDGAIDGKNFSEIDYNIYGDGIYLSDVGSLHKDLMDIAKDSYYEILSNYSFYRWDIS